MKGLFLFDKPIGISSFKPIPRLRRLSQEARVGHAGTLDPFASGLMLYLVGRDYTRIADSFLHHNKAYKATFHLGIVTDSYDSTGVVIRQSTLEPTLSYLEQALATLQGELQQIPPMFSAKKVNGKRLYTLARAGEEIERAPCRVHVEMKLLSYAYPLVEVEIFCSKGTYVRSLAYDLGELLLCGAHVSALRRTQSGPFLLENAYSGDIWSPDFQLEPLLQLLESEPVSNEIQSSV